MNRHELEARLKVVQEEIALIESSASSAAKGLESNAAERNKKTEEIEHRLRAEKEVRKKQNSTLWGKSRSFFGSNDKPNLPDDYGRLDGIGLFFDVVKAATLLPLAVEVKQHLDELKAEEG